METTIKGIKIKYNAETRIISWMADWTRCWEFEKAGLLELKHYPNLWGHTDFLVRQ